MQGNTCFFIIIILIGETVLTCIHNQCFEQNIKNIKSFPMKFSIFAGEKYLIILHGQVFVMKCAVVLLVALALYVLA